MSFTQREQGGVQGLDLECTMSWTDFSGESDWSVQKIKLHFTEIHISVSK